MKSDLERKLALFEAARALTDPARRRAFLKAECGSDLTLIAKIERLARAGEGSDEFFSGCISDQGTISAALDRAGISLSADAMGAEGELLDSRIGSYKLLKKIGEGGCGSVYMAEQIEPIRRVVALKVIKLGMDTKSVIARFEAERQALAMMDHPNIARVLDAGATDTGRPYFVMEMVKGVRITDYCDQNQLGIEQRLNLLIQVCRAIQHAHQKGVIHRDIKPSNVLITIHDGMPGPKVIDFGIAKATGEQLAEKTALTAVAQLVGTPAYMSPEQVACLDLDTRSDIYSLGVLLYELLTGRTPFDTKELLKSGVDEMRRTLRERDPCSPSNKLNTIAGNELATMAIQRRVEVPQLMDLIRGDIDWIVMKALEKDRNRRYETADALATDIERFLANEPILARPPSRWYQLQKLVRRNRIVFASAAAVASALLIGTVTSTYLFEKERAAELKQAVLLEKERAAEQKQAVMRHEAESRERLTQAALLAAQQNYPDAEKLLTEIDLNKPSTELSNLLRSLGDWHALNGQWREAAQSFLLLMKANQLEPAAVVTGDYTEAAVALIQSGELDAYERFTQEGGSRFTAMADVSVERVIKSDLLLPPPGQMLKDLAPLAQTASGGYPKLANTKRGSTTTRGAWIALSLGLLEYRQGNYDKAAQWCQQCLLVSRLNPAGNAAANVLLAMCCWHLNQRAQALSQWSTGELEIDGKFKKGLTMGSGSMGFWYDWEIARILSVECQNLFAQSDSSPKDGVSLQPVNDTSATDRGLGEWHALRSEWRLAADCYARALKLDQFDGWKDATNDQISYAACILEAGDTASYEAFWKEELARFDSANSIEVNTLILKSILLQPASDNFLTSLASLAKATSTPITGEWAPGLLDFYDGWRCVSMGLAEYRRGDFAKAVDLSRQSLGFAHNIPARTATARLILAMALHHLGQDDEARSELLQAQNTIKIRFSYPLDHGDADHGMWWDWVIGRRLLYEATGMLNAAPTAR
jgi:eukaryotic-like serine/threonine-protein kinase